MRKSLIILLLFILTGNAFAQFRVSDNKHYLLRDGKPFFWMGDTAWELFHRLNREQADYFLKRRAEQGYTVIQAVALAEFDGLHVPNPNGDLPLNFDDPTQPNEKYFKHVDYIIDKAAEYGLVIGFLQPFLAYGLLRLTSKLDSPTAAAVAAHYGSISMVTFVTAATFLKANDVVYAGYIVAVLALMEAPAIISGLFIAHRASPQTKHAREEKRLFSREIFTNGAILLLTGAFLVGWITGQPGMNKVAGFLDAPFQGILCLFLLDMGLLVARNLHQLRSFTWSLALFGIYMPLIGAGIGLVASRLIGLDVGTGTLFTVLCASASYIAVPAVIRFAIPEARPPLYFGLSLGITFPLNILLGIPLYHWAARSVLL